MDKAHKFRVTRFSKSGHRVISMMDVKELQKFRAQRLKEIRKNELGLTQKDFANAVGETAEDI